MIDGFEVIMDTVNDVFRKVAVIRNLVKFDKLVGDMLLACSLLTKADDFLVENIHIIDKRFFRQF